MLSARAAARITRAACVAVLLSGVFGLSACEDDMFPFSRKNDGRNPIQPTKTRVPAEVGATLQEASAFPAVEADSPASAPLALTCERLARVGDPPDTRLLPTDSAQPGQSAWVVRGAPRGPFALVNGGREVPRAAIWSLEPGEPGDTPRLVDEDPPLRVDPDQSRWVGGFLILDVGCLPNQRLLVAVKAFAPSYREALFVYDVRGGTFSGMGQVASDPSESRKLFELLPLSDERALALHYSEQTRYAPEVYYNRYNHFVLFTPTHPEGREVLELGIDDGNVERWTLGGTTLSIETRDPRRGADGPIRAWSLDLRRALSR